MKTFRWLVLVIFFTRLALAYQPKPGEFSYGYRVVSFDSKTKQWAVDFTAPFPQTEGKNMVIEIRIARFALTCLVGKERTQELPQGVCDLEVGRLLKRHTGDENENAKDYLEIRRTSDTLGYWKDQRKIGRFRSSI
ncbi:MAG TPA: hypothetical protein VNY05_17220 [Candidatus Acidoferrales bacterium]|nr:hypothetical protein [Candidatus Acidoferrales bacterium]